MPPAHSRPPARAATWRVRTRTLAFTERPLLMGIVNVTPDSFSDGGRYVDADAAVAHALRLVDDGAEILDIGGESTRPYATPVAGAEELDRVLPVIERLSRETAAPLSIDTSKAEVARAAVEAGAEIINDVTGLAGDPEMARVAISSGAGVCVMHMQGTPQTMQDDPRYDDVVGEVSDYLAARRDALVASGMDRAQICLDPGIGFGKTHEHNLELMRNVGRLHNLGCPLLVGHSRKGFLAKLIGEGDAGRTAATIGAAIALAAHGVHVIRVHEPRPVREALLAFLACRPEAPLDNRVDRSS